MFGQGQLGVGEEEAISMGFSARQLGTQLGCVLEPLSLPMVGSSFPPGCLLVLEFCLFTKACLRVVQLCRPCVCC